MLSPTLRRWGIPCILTLTCSRQALLSPSSCYQLPPPPFRILPLLLLPFPVPCLPPSTIPSASSSSSSSSSWCATLHAELLRRASSRDSLEASTGGG
eukprot:4776017-Pyramimonas_sp.AAC.2